LKKYIDEVNQYSSDLYQKLQVKMNLKADQDLVEKFKQNVESKIVQDLNSKMDKIDHKRLQNALKKKIDTLENKLVKNPANDVNDGPSKPAMITKNNNVCISCDRPLDNSFKRSSSIGTGGGFKAG